jgi:hypothetical protein
MAETPDSGGDRFRREWKLRGQGSRLLLVRGRDLQPDEEAEAADVPLGQLGHWLADSSQLSILAEICHSAVDSAGLAAGSLYELKARLEAAFRSGRLVVVRSGETGGAARVDQALRTRHVEAAGEDPSHRSVSEPAGGGKRGWEISSRTGQALAAKKSDLRPGEPTEDPEYPVSQIDRWIANPSDRAALVEMYKSVYGFGDAAYNSPNILKIKIAQAFRKRELFMLVTAKGGATGGGEGGPGGGAAKAPGDKSSARSDAEQAKDQKAAAPTKDKVEKTWFRARLVDEDGEPLDGEPYEMVDSNGTQRTGKLDKDGSVYIPPILNPGECTISFPEIHLNPLKNPKRKRTRKTA